MSTREVNPHAAGAQSPAQGEEPGILIFDDHGQRDSPAPQPAASGGSGGKPPGQSGGTIIGTGGHDDGNGNDDSFIQLANNGDEDEREGSKASEPVLVGSTSEHTASDETMVPDLLGPGEDELSFTLPADETVEPEPEMAMAGVAEESRGFGRWDAAACILCLMAVGSLGTALFSVITIGGMH